MSGEGAAMLLRSRSRHEDEVKGGVGRGQKRNTFKDLKRYLGGRRRGLDCDGIDDLSGGSV